MLIGVPLGLIAGYRGRLDIRRHHEDHRRVVLAIPQLILALALAQLLSPSLESAMLALSLTYWPYFTRIVYAETRRLSSSLFVDALRGIGAGTGRIVFLHILPNALSPVIVRATIGLGFTILVAAVLGFLGMGATPPAPDWGLAIAESRTYPPAGLVVCDLPGPRDPDHGDGLQPSWRVACATSSIRASGGLDDPGPQRPRPQGVDPRRRRQGSDPRRYRAHPGARPHPGRRGRVGLRQVHADPRNHGHPAARRDGPTAARSGSRARTCWPSPKQS
jgi:hypothetical protein